MERRPKKKIGGQDISYILNLFLGSITNQWMRKLFLNTNEMVLSASQSVKMGLSLLGRYVYSVFSVVVVKSIILCLRGDFDVSVN